MSVEFSKGAILITEGARVGELNALGEHVLLELRDCDAAALGELERVRNTLRQAALASGATIVSEAFYQFEPFGVSGIVIIAESHLSIHTWPEHRYAAADIFTCGDLLRLDGAIRVMIEGLGCRNPSIMHVKRGLLGPEQVRIPHRVSPAPAEVRA